MIAWLKKWADENDSIAHLILAFVLCFIHPLFSAGFMLGIEGTQIDILGIKGRWKDTVTDLIADGTGIALYYFIRFLTSGS